MTNHERINVSYSHSLVSGSLLDEHHVNDSEIEEAVDKLSGLILANHFDPFGNEPTIILKLGIVNIEVKTNRDCQACVRDLMAVLYRRDWNRTYGFGC
ncbi:hypothetical protein [Leuconostoc citreum]|uniref:hypothetical protein n=1 Tax=Leuconostoc citreum TaxID=33964 RepID=UPI00066004EA|nr:hypothetical protein [Leuconostoc citreum]MBA5937428.1 hypothetical protein [Leuconostoc citreum]MBE4726281.1 hypothetical protein [Leuconostoc citreum]MCT3069475.1 hypothetical protein [Leuconostoc citreum]QEA37176.1 hypothetical protein FGL87_07595 [Leuconostoc citreum]GEK60664.1 hypothetical protein LCI01_03000 [Leuconostoc citreum]